MVRLLRKIETYISYFERIMIVLILSTIIILSFGGIILRNIGTSIPPWVSAILQYSVLWVSFIGGSLASRYNRQVNINFLSIFIVKLPLLNKIVNIITNLFVVPVALALFYGAYTFIKVEYEWGIDVPSIGLPCWIFESVLVYAFMAISFKYFIRFLEALTGQPFPEMAETIDEK